MFALKDSQTRHLLYSALAMCFVVALSNVLIQYPVRWFVIDHVLTYSAFTYPITFLINDLTNRCYGQAAARKVVYVGCVVGVIVSWFLASPRIAIASSAAFLCGQLLDIAVFTPLRRRAWWIAPLAAVCAGSIADTILFFAMAFAPFFAFLDSFFFLPDKSIYAVTTFFGSPVSVWVSLAAGDLIWKVLMGLIMLAPYGAILAVFIPSIYKGTAISKNRA
ncbi:VUT family protein [Bartonella sp. DGB2]|uniref:VUT family protein n=1 Tax=Bartonella sp. DGB2 TaxID=3388426 RepID=UPI00398FE4BF